MAEEKYKKCFAYETLKKQIGKQCERYYRLRDDQDLGKMKGMYEVDNELDIKIPSDDTSAFFQGGIISTIACFEEFVANLLDEACDTILYERNDCQENCVKCKDLLYEHVVNREKGQNHELPDKDEKKMRERTNPFNLPLMHTWNKFYMDTLGHDLCQFIFIDDDNGSIPIKYYYPVGEGKISLLEIKKNEKEIICMILRLFYGVRCVMAHGDASRTLNEPKTLKHFPCCSLCIGQKDEFCKGTYPKSGCDTVVKAEHCFGTECENFAECKDCDTKPSSILKNISQLSTLLDECIEKGGRKTILGQSRHFPRKVSFEVLENVKKQVAHVIITQYDLDIDTTKDEEINEKYAYFHMCRVFHWLKENKRGMYITYPMVVRINQFVLCLAFRMWIAVARILIDEYKLPIGIFGVDITNIKQAIEDFEAEHHQNVKRYMRI